MSQYYLYHISWCNVPDAISTTLLDAMSQLSLPHRLMQCPSYYLYHITWCNIPVTISTTSLDAMSQLLSLPHHLMQCPSYYLYYISWCNAVLATHKGHYPTLQPVFAYKRVYHTALSKSSHTFLSIIKTNRSPKQCLQANLTLSVIVQHFKFTDTHTHVYTFSHTLSFTHT